MPQGKFSDTLIRLEAFKKICLASKIGPSPKAKSRVLSQK